MGFLVGMGWRIKHCGYRKTKGNEFNFFEDYGDKGGGETSIHYCKGNKMDKESVREIRATIIASALALAYEKDLKTDDTAERENSFLSAYHEAYCIVCNDFPHLLDADAKSTKRQAN